MKTAAPVLLFVLFTGLASAQQPLRLYGFPKPYDSMLLTERLRLVKSWERNFAVRQNTVKGTPDFIMIPERVVYRTKFYAAPKQPVTKTPYWQQLAGAITEQLIDQYLWQRLYKDPYKIR